MASWKKRLDRELLTMQRMVDLYCRAHHEAPWPCPPCAQFLSYASGRLDKCPYAEDKPTCVKCPIHCYRPEPKEYARQVMRYAGPRMLLRHPVLALLHMLDGKKKALHPKASRKPGPSASE